jgi:hypothetical protein
MQQRAVLIKPPGKLRLNVQSCIIGMGQTEVDFLLNLYEKLLQLLDLSPTRDDGNDIEIEGYGLRALLEGESGIHLFYTANRTPIPIRVTLNGRQDPESAHRVIRLYDATYTITDLRSGFANAADITAEEFLLLVYAGVPAQLRKALYPL